MTPIELVMLEFLLIAILCLFLIRYYKGNMVTADVSLAVYLSWVLGFAGILLLPYDVSYTLVGNVRSRALDEMWRFVYWRYNIGVIFSSHNAISVVVPPSPDYMTIVVVLLCAVHSCWHG
jgi:hypothetical protein